MTRGGECVWSCVRAYGGEAVRGMAVSEGALAWGGLTPAFMAA